MESTTMLLLVLKTSWTLSACVCSSYDYMSATVKTYAHVDKIIENELECLKFADNWQMKIRHRRIFEDKKPNELIW